jgi:bifunctional DNase/RNase
MIEMRVHGARRCRHSGDTVVVLEERGGAASRRLELAVSRAEGHALLHELRAQRTLRAQTFELMAKVLAGLDGKVSGVEIVPDGDGRPSAALRCEHPGGEIRVPAGIGQAIGLALHLRLTVLVDEALLPAESDQAPDAVPVGSTEVPEAFRRAFGG